MRPGFRTILIVALALCAAHLGFAGFAPGKNKLMLRGQPEALYFLPGGQPAADDRPAVLFLPGDRGWAGKAIAMARAISSWGYDVYGLDTNTYLTSFTGETILTELQIADDLLTVSRTVAPNRRVLLAGWSAGAGLALLAASEQAGKAKYEGVVALALSDENVLAWRWKDNLSLLTKAPVDEPTFPVKPRMAAVSPLPLAMLRSTNDEYVGHAETEELFKAAREPRRLVEVPSRNHRFDGNDEGFYRELKGAIEWAIQQSR